MAILHMNQFGSYPAAIVMALLAAIFASTIPAAAHPHMFITGKSEIMMGSGNAVVGVRHAWTFDEFFSSAAIVGLDKNSDGAYSREELAGLAKINIESLSEYDFFTFLTRGTARGEFAEPDDYWLEFSNSALTLHFSMKLKAPVKVEDGRLEIAVYDPEYYVAFSFDKEAPAALGGEAPGCELMVDRGTGPDALQQSFLSKFSREETVPGGDFGQMFAERIFVSCK